MTTLTKLEHNIETGEVKEISLTSEELALAELQAIALQNRLDEEANRAAAKTALLAKLGISEDEAKLLLS